MSDFINIFIFLANIIGILLLYYSFGKNLAKQKKILYSVIAIGAMYIIVTIIYFFSSIGISTEKTAQAKDMIVMSFVPVNTILFLPISIWTFNKCKQKKITKSQLNFRTTIMIILAIIVMVCEFFYFRNFQLGIKDIIKQNENTVDNTINNTTENAVSSTTNTISNTTENMVNNTTNNIVNNTVKNNTENTVSNTTQNTVKNNT